MDPARYFYGFEGNDPEEDVDNYLSGADLGCPESPNYEECVIGSGIRDPRCELIARRKHLFKETLETRAALLSQFYERTEGEDGRVYLVPRDRNDHTMALLGTSQEEADRNWHKILVGLPKTLSDYINSHLDAIEDKEGVKLK